MSGKQYVNHMLTFDAEPICGAALVPPGKGDEISDCPDCEREITRTLDLLAKISE